jgi:hypothetical protein
MSGFEEAPTRYVPATPESLVGMYRRIGRFGPTYEVMRVLNTTEALITLLETGEQVEYPTEDILTDPDPDADPPALS